METAKQKPLQQEYFHLTQQKGLKESNPSISRRLKQNFTQANFEKNNDFQSKLISKNIFRNNPQIRDKYKYNKPYIGNNKVLLHPDYDKDNDESNNRQRENCNRNPNYKRRENIWSKKICGKQSKNRYPGKQQITRQINIDQWSVCTTPKVVESDNMTIKPRKEKENNKVKSFDKEKKNTSFKDRLLDERARIILSQEKAIHWIDKGLFTVKSQTGVGRYRVEWRIDKWICNCPDYTKNNRDCKHIIAVQHYLQGYITIDNQKPKEEKKQYKRNWSNYKYAQMQEPELFPHLLKELVSTIEETDQHMGRPRLNLQDLIYGCILKTYHQKPNGEMRYILDEAMRRQYIRHSFHPNAISKTLLQPEITPILQELLTLSSLPLVKEQEDTDLAVDSSGFRCSSFNLYCEHAHGTRNKRNWLKCHICIDVDSKIITSLIITDEHGADSPQFKKLLLDTSKNFNIGEVTADLGYSSRKNYEIVDKLGGKPFIPFKKNATGRSRGTALWNKAYHSFKLHREEFDKHYHQRSNVEAVFHSIKRRLGENISSKNQTAQINELLCKIISYNITIVIRTMIDIGLTPEIFPLQILETNN